MVYGRHDLIFFFFNDTATTEIYTLSLHDALPISTESGLCDRSGSAQWQPGDVGALPGRDRKSTRLNSSHVRISYAVFCLKKKKILNQTVGRPLSYRLKPYPRTRWKLTRPVRERRS